MKYYVKPDSKLNGEFPDKDTAPVLETADGLQEVDVPATSVQYFTRYWWQYRLLGNGRLQAPGNLPSLEINYLQGIIDQQANRLDQTFSNATNLEQVLDAATRAQTEAQQRFTQQSQQFQEQFGSLTQQIVKLQQTVTELQTNK
ncbi:hypothetical protein [Secundilactobacillus kimchicus]|uniref:Uncharacterized protein n=1 Tax=Secundilactobacillus kimchicus JCM 15530 TaxID=1302272 RepID=A0A0R1HPE3_9LACO|nr:hypothetical protein [Secundilactobacillus kimchicus]KRK48203.1 hypothetical protein FC96_GL001942 [Secundilactobacillus kimchicus JCM 15530]